MNYVYPKLSSYDFGIFRMGGAGLGNILFCYARAIVYAKKNNFKIIWPTWLSLKIGPILRNEKDKRFYWNLFDNNTFCMNGFLKIWLLISKNKIFENNIHLADSTNNSIVVIDRVLLNFDAIKYDSDFIYQNLVTNLKSKHKKVFEFDFTNSICVHIRLGDFSINSSDQLKNGVNNIRLPISWYAKIINDVRSITGKSTDAYIFSDGRDEELEEVLRLCNVKKLSFGTSIADILAMSKAPLLIASGSTFSLWARFLGRTNTIAYKNQIKEYLLTENDTSFEIEIDENENIPNDIKKKIAKIYCR